MLHLGPGASQQSWVTPSPDVPSGNTLGSITRRSHKFPTARNPRASTIPGSSSLASSGHHMPHGQAGGGGSSVIRSTLSEPGEVSVGLTGSGDKPARMLEGNRFETELPHQPGSNSVAIAATDNSGNRSNYQFQVGLPSANVQPLLFTYDLDGNLTSDGIRSYEWDILSRLTKITWATNKTTAFKYNALGQRCDRTDTDGTAVTKHFYLFDGAEMLDHRSGSTASTAPIDRRYFAQGEQRKSGTNWENYYYCRDHLGSIREVVKSVGTTNTLAARYDYDPYGKRLTQYEAPSYICDLGYTGHLTVPSLVAGQTEMVLTNFRAYDPQLAIWLSADPLGEADGLNLYAYCYRNPLNFYDPDGLTAAGAWEGFHSFFIGNARNIYHGARTLDLTGARDYDWAGTENNMITNAIFRYSSDSCFRKSSNYVLKKFAEHIAKTHGDGTAARMGTGFFSKGALIKSFGKTRGNIYGFVLIAGAANGDLRYQVEQFANQLRQLGMNEIDVGSAGITSMDLAGLAGKAMLTGSLAEDEIEDSWNNFKKSCAK